MAKFKISSDFHGDLDSKYYSQKLNRAELAILYETADHSIWTFGSQRGLRGRSYADRQRSAAPTEIFVITTSNIGSVGCSRDFLGAFSSVNMIEAAHTDPSVKDGDYRGSIPCFMFF